MIEEPERIPKFQPMEWAVLLNDRGGRLFRAETTLWFGDVERVVEHYIQPGDTKSRFQLYPEAEIGTPVIYLLKVPDKATAEKVVEQLRKEAEEANRVASQAKYEAQQKIQKAHKQMRILYNDPED